MGVAYASHLVVDATTPAGVPLLFPLSTARVAVPIGGHSGEATALIWVACVVALGWDRRRRRGRPGSTRS